MNALVNERPEGPSSLERYETSIKGLFVKPLDRVFLDKGNIMKMLQHDSELFTGFGEAYFSKINPGAIKGWHKHRNVISCYAVPYGFVKLVVLDDRDDSPTFGNFEEIYMGPENYVLARVPTGVWNGFKGISASVSLIAVCLNLPHDPEEMDRLPKGHKSIPYDWGD